MNNPLVSVIVPTYNSSRFLEECLESIKNQTYQNIEIIVVDNNSTDNTKEIASSFCHSREGGNPENFIVKVFNQCPERSAQFVNDKDMKGKDILNIGSDKG